MATTNVVLSQRQHEFVESLVQSGSYQNASEDDDVADRDLEDFIGELGVRGT